MTSDFVTRVRPGHDITRPGSNWPPRPAGGSGLALASPASSEGPGSHGPPHVPPYMGDHLWECAAAAASHARREGGKVCSGARTSAPHQGTPPPTPIRAASSRARSPLRAVPGGSGERPDIRACARAALRGVGAHAHVHSAAERPAGSRTASAAVKAQGHQVSRFREGRGVRRNPET